MESIDAIRDQLQKQRRKVDFDTYDLTVDELVRRIENKRIDISPEYQRQFRWNDERQSALIETILLGLPMPNLFMATNSNTNVANVWEIVDGLQRSLSIVNYVHGDAEQRQEMGLHSKPLKLRGLEKMSSLNGLAFHELPDDVKTMFLDRPIKVTVLNDKSDRQVRFDLFERLNTGGISLTDQEVRECIYRGPFMRLVDELSEEDVFRKIILFNRRQINDGTPAEYVLRFFALYDKYNEFDHSVKEFLNEYADWATDGHFDFESKKALFLSTFEYLDKCFPDGIKRSQNTTPANYYEGIAVGAALALGENPDLSFSKNTSWTKSEEYLALTTNATNSRPKVIGRIEYAKGMFEANG